MRNFLRADGTFKLQDFLGRHEPHIKQDSSATQIYLAASIPAIDVDALTYFAISIFWRGSIHGWDEDGQIPVPLGPYGEAMRSYLCGGAAFPKDVALHVAVRESGPASRLTATPVGKRLGAVKVYKFALPGLALSICVGKALTDQMRRFCFVRGHGHPIALTPLLDPIILRDAELYLQGRTSGR